jgi:Na+/H+ antiporter NhaD/arsenite permease-like protein
VGILFAAIFLTAAPVLTMLLEGRGGALGGLMQLVTRPDGAPDPLSLFWLTGLLSAFLDNAPTYLVFFQAAGGDAVQLMGPLQTSLIAISCGAVFMGALSYIGNAPNFMVRAIAENHGIRMPSFFGYMAWACLFLLPVFALISWLFFS